MMSKLPDLWDEHRHQRIGPEVLSGPKGWMAPGALDTQVRSRVLDALGITAQMVFPTFALVQFARSENLDILYGGTQALNRAVATFCAPDSRILISTRCGPGSQRQGVPFVLHVGGGKLLPKAFHNNGLPRPRDWLGGGENLRAKDFPVIHH